MNNTRSPLAAGLRCWKITSDSRDGIFVLFFFRSIPIRLIRHSLYLSGPSPDQEFTVVSFSSPVCVSPSGSSNRGGAATQAPRQTAQSPADTAHLELPDLGAEDVLELQLQQLTLAQFTVSIMEHAIPLLKTGRSLCSCFNNKGKGADFSKTYKSMITVCYSSFFCLRYCKYPLIRFPSLMLPYQQSFDLVKPPPPPPPPPLSHSLSLFFLRGFACVPSCSGAALWRHPPARGQRLWAGLGRSQPGGDGAGKSKHGSWQPLM